MQQKLQTFQLSRVQTDSETSEIKLPSNPGHTGGQARLVPTHRHIENKDGNDQKARPDRGRAAVQKSQNVIDINEGRVRSEQQAVQEPDQETSNTVPVITGSASPKVERDRLIQTVAVSKAQQTTVCWSNSDTTMGLFLCAASRGRQRRTSCKVGLGALFGRTV